MPSKASIKIPIAFKPLWKPYRYKVYYGGRGAGKSWSFALTLLLMGVKQKRRVLCTREVQGSMKQSVHKLLSQCIDLLKVGNFYRITRDAIFGKNGTEFIFHGLKHDPMQIKSLEGVDICWVEEAQKISNESWDILIPTIRKTGSEIWVSFNPNLETDPTYVKYVVNEQRDNALLVKVNYWDNPYFGAELKEELDYQKELDYDDYLHIWEGYCKTTSEAQIFKGKFAIEEFKAPNDVVFYYGLDWGFSQDPTAVLRCYIIDRELYIDYESGGTQIELDSTYKLIDSIPEAKRYTIRADSARPESISFVRRQGYKIESVHKWAGSVEDGIEHIRSFRKVHIHTRCMETASEFVKYSYKT
ncbi:PBSX family phage terminase large subunit, partial [candidate division WWE3 bacterium]|nr:PBSX family phage terminase large subunit [candidate division WWE3 bacterium]